MRDMRGQMRGEGEHMREMQIWQSTQRRALARRTLSLFSLSLSLSLSLLSPVLSFSLFLAPARLCWRRADALAVGRGRAPLSARTPSLQRMCTSPFALNLPRWKGVEAHRQKLTKALEEAGLGLMACTP